MILEGRVRIVCIALAAILGTGAMLSSCSRSEDPAPETLERVRVVLLPYVGYAPLIIAQEEGHFRQEGLEVEFVESNVSMKTLPLFVQGKLDVFVGTLNAGLMNAIARGADIRIVADKGYAGPPSDTYFVLAARRELIESGRLRTPADLKEMRVARSPTGSAQYVLDAVLQKGGLSEEDVHVEPLTSMVMEEALARGKIDVAVTGEPFLTRMVQHGVALPWISAGEVLPEFQFAIVAYGPKLLREKPDVGQGFMKAFLRGVRQFNEGKTARNLELLAKATGLEADLLRQMAWPYMRNDGQVNVRSVIEFQKWALAAGFLDREVRPQEFWDPRFVEQANKSLPAAAEPTRGDAGS